MKINPHIFHKNKYTHIYVYIVFVFQNIMQIIDKLKRGIKHIILKSYLKSVKKKPLLFKNVAFEKLFNEIFKYRRLN